MVDPGCFFDSRSAYLLEKMLSKKVLLIICFCLPLQGCMTAACVAGGVVALYLLK